MNIQKVISFNGLKVNTVYNNDSHGQVKNIRGFLSARDEFFKQKSGEPTLTFASGDVFLDTNKLNDKVAGQLINKTDAVAVGNHDIGAGETYFKNLLETFGLQRTFLGANVHFGDKQLNKYIKGSRIIKKQGEKIGVIGLAPMDFKNHGHNAPDTKSITIDDLKGTTEALKSEIKQLEAQGINKIFLLAHTGEKGEKDENYYDLFASLGGIDVIIGGHDHREVNRYTLSKRGEPVLICSTGKSKEHGFGGNLDYFGQLELDFDDNGVLNLPETKSRIIKTPQLEGSENGKVICTLFVPLRESDKMTGHSEVGNLVADSNLWYVNNKTKGNKADFAFVNPGTIRDNFDSSEITEEKIASALPFTESKLIKTQLTKAQIINTLSHCAKSTALPKIYPGAMQVSGMEYTITPDLSVRDVHILNPDGSIKYNLDDFSENDYFTCVYDTFLMTGVAGLSELKKDEKEVEKFDISRQEALIEYLTKAENLSDFTIKRITKE